MPRKQDAKTHDKDSGQGGESPTTEAGEFVREEMHHIGEGKRAPQSPKQAIAIGLSKARRSGVKLPVPKKGKASEATRRKAAADTRKGRQASKSAGTKAEAKSSEKTAPRRKAAATKSPRRKASGDKAPRQKAAAAEKKTAAPEKKAVAPEKAMSEKAPRRAPRKKAEAADATA
ncbi:MAG: DUF6496 domain-containing protein [Polyangiaceae bacterium]